jgi:hypothetical protein
MELINHKNAESYAITQRTSSKEEINNRISLNMTFTFTIRISWHFSSAREFQMGNFQKY